MVCADESGLSLNGKKGSLKDLPYEKKEALNRIRTVIGHAKEFRK